MSEQPEGALRRLAEPQRDGRRLPAASATTSSGGHKSFEMLDLLKIRLKRTFDLYNAGSLDTGFVARIESLALTIQQACTHDSDAALANLHLDYETSYAVVHHLQAAILCELIGRKMGVGEASRLSLVKAGLTHDVGLIDIQDALDRQMTPLTSLQRQRIARHPVDSEWILTSLGVTDAAWLDSVRHHHERLDGSGYPDGHLDDVIKLPARVLAIADIYSAMVRDRPYRKAMVSGKAMRKLMLDQGKQTDNRLIQMMIKEIGVFPPGALVRLANGETAIVKKRTANSACPLVHAFVKPDGMPMLGTIPRDTSTADFHIEGMVPFSNYRGSIVILRNLWNRP